MPSQNFLTVDPLPSIDIKVYRGELSVEKDLLKFEKDVLCEFEKTDGTSLWENVISSLNEDTRTLVTDSRTPSSRQQSIDFTATKSQEVVSTHETKISIRVETKEVPDSGSYNA